MVRRIGLACAVPLLGCALASPAASQEVNATAGALYAVGRYGGTGTTKAAISFINVQASLSSWQLTATLPYIYIESQGQQIEVGGILLPRGGGQVRGFGDVVLAIERPLPLGQNAPVQVSVGGRIKVPTGAASISTGRSDYGVDVELSKTLGNVTPFVKAGYRWYGDSAELDLENGWEGSAGARLTSGKTAFSASYDWSESAYGGPTSKALYGLMSIAVSDRWRGIVFGSKGLSAGAPDIMVGLGVTRTFK